MLNKLYKKLRFLFATSVMVIITIVLLILAANFVQEERNNEGFLFQRMATLFIYRMEQSPQDVKVDPQRYEEDYDLWCVARDVEGRNVFQKQKPFSVELETVLARCQEESAKKQISSTGEKPVTSQGGIFRVRGNKGTRYFAILAEVIAADGQVYQLTLLHQQKNAAEILGSHLPLYFLVWICALLCVLALTRLLLKKTMEPTERMLKSQKEFIAHASHELKAPLAVMMANVDTLRGLEARDPAGSSQPWGSLGASDDPAKAAVKTLDTECARLSKLVKDLLLLAASDARTWTLRKSSVNVDTLLIRLYEAYEPICAKQGIRLELKLAEESYPTLNTDESRMFQVLNILMANAVEHGYADTWNRKSAAAAVKSIQIQSAFTSRVITFAIIDHGQGIPESDMDRIFERFYCGDPSHTDKSHFGLGLSIAKELTDMLGGSLDVKPTEGGGTTFFAAFPL
ncbi:MAG: HAMP domain-containing histidine kinase [Firmicutes bacterium]|nr:HAMP domain-containing histidine kinase [Bacillota bacterium]